MKKLSFVFALIFGVSAIAADVKISQLPVGNASTSQAQDSFPYVDTSSGLTKRMRIWDLINSPPLATPTFTGAVTAPTFIGALTGNVTGNVTGTASGNTTYSANNHGVVLSSATNAMTVIAPDASTAKTLISGGSSANPAWGVLTVPGGGTGLTTINAHSLVVGNGSGTATAISVGTSGALLQSRSTTDDPIFTTATYPGTATGTGTILRADGTNWAATTATYPATTTVSQILYSSSANVIGGISTANTAALVTNSSGVPAFTSGSSASNVLRTNGTTISFDKLTLSTDVSGTLSVANGGTGTATMTSGSLVVGQGTSAVTFIAPSTSGNILTSNGSSWTSAIPNPVLAIANKVTTYTATTDDNVINLDSSGGTFTLTLYNPSGNTGRQLTLTKTDTSTNCITLGSFNITGAARKICTQYESATIYSDGTSWLVRSHTYKNTKTTYTPGSSWNTNVTFSGYWIRNGKNMMVRISVLCSGAPNAANLSFSLPTGYTIDTADMTDPNSVDPLGIAMAVDNGVQYYPGDVIYGSSTTVFVQPYKTDATYATNASSYNNTVPFTFGNLDTVSVNFTVPITDWW